MSNDDNTGLPQGGQTPANGAPGGDANAAGSGAPQEPIAPFGNPYQQPEPYTPDPGSLYHSPEAQADAQPTGPTQQIPTPNGSPQYGAPQQPSYNGGQQPPYAGAAPYGQQSAGGVPPYGQPAQTGVPQYGAPGQGAPGQGSPYGAAAYPGTPNGSGGKPPKKKLGLILGIAGGALAAIIAIIIAVVAISGAGANNTAKGDGDGGGTSTSSKGDGKKTVAKSAEEAVKLYLNAIAKGDSATAIALLDKPGDKSLLTDEVLKASNEIAPITKIKVDPATNKYYAQVDTTYMVGEDEVTTTYSVSERNGKWRISRGVQEVMLPSGISSLGATLNGVAIADAAKSVNVFPGGYQLAITNKNFELTGTTDFVVESGDDYSARPDAQVVMSADGSAAAQKAVVAAVQACMAEKTLKAGCGLTMPAKLSDGTALTEGSVTRTLSGDAQTKLDTLKGSPDYSNPFLVNMDYIGSVDVKADCAGTPCSVWGSGTSLRRAIVDLSKEPAVVTWD